MKLKREIAKLKLAGLLLFLMHFTACSNKEISIVVKEGASSRISYGAQKLQQSLEQNGYQVQMLDSQYEVPNNQKLILIGTAADENVYNSAVSTANDSLVLSHKESFVIAQKQQKIYICGGDESGALYACMNLIESVNEKGTLPTNISVADYPKMTLRGACVGLQKTNILPGRMVYEYPFTPENFPWFYDKNLWIKYLDELAEDRFNALYLWSGHPFASLVKLDDYPFALEVDEETFQKNEEIYRFLTAEAEKRGICIIQMFYNIILSKPFAEKYGLETQDRGRGIMPLIADYTQKSIEAFIEKYPNVGLLVTLGEAMNTIDDDVEWFTKTILPAVKEGMKKQGTTVEPPIVLRGHDTDAERVMNASLPLYKNLFTMYKYNGESLTTYEPHDEWANIPSALSKLGSAHISNVHILANLEPFRYGSPDFIQKSVKAMEQIQGAKGLHLYPQASYWDWPYSADKTEKRLLQTDRDWIWFKAWGRYSWNSDRSKQDENDFWTTKLGNFYDCGKAGASILEAYEETGEIAPKLLREFGISDGNRQTLLLGMFMGQLVNPQKYHVYESFVKSSGPLKETLAEYAQKEWEGKTHQGETPEQIIQEVVTHADKAVAAIDAASKDIKTNKEEFERLKNDVHCYSDIAHFYYNKVKAALLVLRYSYSNDISDLEKAIPYLQKSTENYQALAEKTKDTYLYANSMQTYMRRIPIEGKGGINKHWTELLPQYHTELEVFIRNVEMLKQKGESSVKKAFPKLKPVKVELLDKKLKSYSLIEAQQVYSDNKAAISKVADELQNLKGIQLSDKQQQEVGTELHFQNDEAVKVLVGYFNTNSYTVLRPPTLETNAHANDRGQADIKIANAMMVDGLYPVNIYTYHFSKGMNTLQLPKGRALVLGFISGDESISIHDAGMGDDENSASVDWLFY